MPTTMQIRTRRRRGRKISRRRPRRQSRMSRRQSLSRRRLKPRSGGTTKENEEIDPATIALARNLLDNTEIKKYLNNVEKMMIVKLGGDEDKLYEAILEAAAAAKQQAGGAHGDSEEGGENPHSQPPSSVLSPTTVFRNILDIIRRTSIRIPEGRLERIMLVGLILMMFMQAVEARRGGFGRGNRRHVSTAAIQTAWDPTYSPDRPGQVRYFINALFAFFGFGPEWVDDPQWQGPRFGP